MQFSGPSAGNDSAWKAVGHGDSAARAGRAAARARGHPIAARSPPPPAWRHCRWAICTPSRPRRAARSPSPSPTTASTGTSATARPGTPSTTRSPSRCSSSAPTRCAPDPPGRSFSFTLDNAHLRKLARTPVSVHKILVVMLVPRSAGRLAARRPRPPRPAALLLLGQPGRPPGHRPAPAPPCGSRPRASSTTGRCARS